MLFSQMYDSSLATLAFWRNINEGWVEFHARTPLRVFKLSNFLLRTISTCRICLLLSREQHKRHLMMKDL